MSEQIDVDDLPAAIAHWEATGYRLDTILPADDPSQAWMSDGSGSTIELVSPSGEFDAPEADGADLVIRRSQDGERGDGRAGLTYRDLIPGRFGGEVIASHITIDDGGPTADYPHHHDEIDFQTIICVTGWVDVVYEDQGPPFRMHPGDCVVQPPTIGHRVIASSSGMAVFEVASPARHPTHRRHDLTLPTDVVAPDREFGGQRFVRHVAEETEWRSELGGAYEARPTAIGEATRGAGDVNFVRIPGGSAVAMPFASGASSCVLFVQSGEVTVEIGSESESLTEGDSAATRAPGSARLTGIAESTELVLVTLM